MMKNSLNFLLSASTLVLFLTFASCGKKEAPEVSTEPAESGFGNILNAAQKTADKANAQTEKTEKALR